MGYIWKVFKGVILHQVLNHEFTTFHNAIKCFFLVPKSNILRLSYLCNEGGLFSAFTSYGNFLSASVTIDLLKSDDSRHDKFKFLSEVPSCFSLILITKYS